MNKKKRPLLQNLLQDGTSEIESFQNTTIRPIVKMQHHLLLISFKNYLQKRKIDFANYSEKDKLNQINSIFTKDLAYKNISLGNYNIDKKENNGGKTEMYKNIYHDKLVLEKELAELNEQEKQ